MTTNFVSKGTELIQKAVTSDNAEEFEQALTYYSRGIECLLTAIKYEKNQKIIEKIQLKAVKYLKRAEDIKESLNKSQKNRKEESKEEKGNIDTEADEESSKLKNGLCSAIVVEKPNIKWCDVAGLTTAKELLKEVVILPVILPQLFIGKRKPFSGILLYGPPGTGKSYLAKAVATEANNSTFFSVSSSDLISKFVGESEKLIKYLFQMARTRKPSIIFIDEIDSLATKRSGNDQSSTRRVKTELLVQMQGVGTDCNGVLTLGATNCPWDLDPAVRRRFAKRVYIPLPNKLARQQMFKLNISDETNQINNELNEKDFDILAGKTDGFSGSDIAAVCQDALMEPVRTLQSATHFKKLPNKQKNEYIWVPCSSGDANGIKMNLMDFSHVERSNIKCEPLKLSHFLRVLQNSNPSVAPSDLQRYEEWTAEFGQDG